MLQTQYTNGPYGLGGVGQQTATQCAPKREPEVLILLEGLHKTTITIQERVQELMQRVAPVMKRVPANPDAKLAATPSVCKSCEVSDKIESAITSLQDSTRVLEDIINRIQV